MVYELNRWDMPTAGILKQKFRNKYYLFRCMAGTTGRYSLWVFSPLTRGEARSLRTLTGDALRDKQAEIFLRRKELTLAVTEETEGIIHRTVGEIQVDEPEPQLAPDVIHRVEQEIRTEAMAIGHLASFA